MKWILLIAFNSLFASDFCDQLEDPRFFQKQIYSRENRLSFTNEGGAFDVGVCWWHSRFQRAALYLARFNPEAQKPTKNEAKKIISQIKSRRQVVEVPGYTNLREFSRDWRELIQKALEEWQISNTAIFAWISGLTGVTENTPENMRKHMIDLSWRVLRGDIVYQKLQLKGISAHSWLVVDFRIIDGGYELDVVDSNYSYVKKFYYYENDPGIYHGSYGGYFVPYIERENELEQMKKAVKKYCQK